MSHRMAFFCAMTSCSVSCHTAASPTPVKGLLSKGIFPVAQASTVVRPRPGLTLTMIAGKVAVVNSQDCTSPGRGCAPVIGALRMPATSSGLRICRSHTELAMLGAVPGILANLSVLEGPAPLEHPATANRAQPNAISTVGAEATLIVVGRLGLSWIQDVQDRPDPRIARRRSYRLPLRPHRPRIALPR